MLTNERLREQQNPSCLRAQNLDPRKTTMLNQTHDALPKRIRILDDQQIQTLDALPLFTDEEMFSGRSTEVRIITSYAEQLGMQTSASSGLRARKNKRFGGFERSCSSHTGVSRGLATSEFLWAI